MMINDEIIEIKNVIVNAVAVEKLYFL